MGLGGIEPYRHEIASWYTPRKNYLICTSFRNPFLPNMDHFQASAPRTPLTHFVRKRELRLAYSWLS